MKKNMFVTGLVLWIGWGLQGCKKNELDMFNSDAAIYFYSGVNVSATDSVGVNFILEPVTKKTDTLYLPVRVEGFSANTDRAISYIVADSSTAREGVHFIKGQAIMHAGRYLDSIPVYLLRTTGMADTIFKLYVHLQASTDFTLGYENHLTYVATVTDKVVPPAWTYNLSSTFGAYSNVKFKFMVSALQVTSFSGLLPSQLAAMASKCKLALAEYEAANGALMDENGQRVVFP